jgi:nucleoside-diphosphate-sugar epimerase/phytoene/squalene synthetase
MHHDDSAFCDAMLPRVSRTFALSIQALPSSLREAVSVSYLLCRVVDTIEDDPKIRGARADLFDAFDAALAGGDIQRLEALARAADLGPTDAERELVGRSGAVFGAYRALPPGQQRAIYPHVAEMSQGMREYSARADASSAGLRLTDLADLERYCYFVAGTVGGLLTSLFLPTVPPGAVWPPASPRSSDDAREAWLRERAKSFGLGLQLVNIVKDVASDLERGDCFLPEALAEAHGVPLDRLLDPAYRKNGLALIRAICHAARGHLDKASEYTLAWPVSREPDGEASQDGPESGTQRRATAPRDAIAGGEAIRLFCSVPLALAYATLREVEEGRASLVQGRAPAVSGALVQAVFAEAVRSVRDDAALASLFERCRLGTIARGPRPKQPNGSGPPSSRPGSRASQGPISSQNGAADGRPSITAEKMQERDFSKLQSERTFSGRVFVTGAAGHVGANLLFRLLSDGRDVRVLLRPEDENGAVDAIEAATGRRAERVLGDLRDKELVRRAMDGCETAFHVAAKVSTLGGSADDLRELFDSNVIGTANLLRAAREVGTRRVVVTGSFSAVGYDPHDPSRPSDESMLFYPFDEHLPYGRTKVQVEHECLKAVAEGQDVVIATSCAVLGPWDYIPSRMGRTLIDFTHGRLRAYIPGGFEFVAARDIVEGHLLAMSRGRTGQKYILSSEFVSVDQLMDIFEEVSGRTRPKLRLPGTVMAGLAEISSFVLTNFFPAVPQRFTPGAVRILRMQRHADTTKARTELGYAPTSIRSAIHEAYAQFALRGLVPQSPSLRSAQNGAFAADGIAPASDPPKSKVNDKEVAA